MNKTKSISISTLVVIGLVILLSSTNTTTAVTKYTSIATPAPDYAACPDMNHNNHVTLVDLSMYGIALNNDDLAGDFSHDEEVDIVDTAIMTHYYGQKLNCKNFIRPH